MSSQIICRKCTGNHLTINCGKIKKEPVIQPPIEQQRQYGNNLERKPLYKVRINNLPIDMMEDELRDLLYDWGHVVRLRVLVYPENSVAYVEFKNEEEADYLVKALHKTPFEQVILHLERLTD